MAYLMPSDPLQFRSMYQREDSEDSDGEGGLGNVSRVLIRPPGHTGKAKKGHLCFDASFESGNLGRVDLISEYEYDLFIRPDTCSPRYRIWFNFTVDNFKQDQILTPIVKSTTRPHWQRIPRKNVWYHKSTAHKHNYILTFAFAFDREEEVYQFSMTLPYSYSRLQMYLALLFNKYYKLNSVHDITVDNNREHADAYLFKETVSFSVQNRNVDLLTIGKLNSSGGGKKRVVVILARVHPGEPPSSYVCQGIIEFLSSADKMAAYLRDHVIFKIVPMLNPDGVYLGNYKSTLMGFDLNHSYHVASPWAHPTIWSVIQMLKGLDDSHTFQLDFVFDIHAHTSLMGCFIYGNTYNDIYRYERHIVFPKLLGCNADDYNAQNTMYNGDVNKVGTARRHLCSILSDCVNCYTFHVSMGGYHLHNASTNTTSKIPYTKESYMRLGRNFTRTFIDYYRMVGVIVTNELSYELRDSGGVSNERLSRSKLRKVKSQRIKSRSPPSRAIDYHKIRSRSLSHFYKQRTSAIQHYTDIYNGHLHVGADPQVYQHPNSFIKRSHCDHEIVVPPKLKAARTERDLRERCRPKSSPVPVVPVVPMFNYPTLPSLSIIDFNQLTRGGIDKAIANIKEKLPNESKSKSSKKR